jgi:hypothetical protein
MLRIPISFSHRQDPVEAGPGGETMYCEYQDIPNRVGKHKCEHPNKTVFRGCRIDYCENVCKFSKCPKGIVNP